MDSARFKLTSNIQRQEEIAEKIEVTPLSADMLHEAEHGG